MPGAAELTVAPEVEERHGRTRRAPLLSAPAVRGAAVEAIPRLDHATSLADGSSPSPNDQTGLRRDCNAQAEQVRSVAVERIGQRIGFLTASLEERLDDALRLHLAL